MGLPVIIQGGMGVYAGTPFLAREVSSFGPVAMGTCSGVCADRWLAYMLQIGDPGGHVRSALGDYPFKESAERILKKYFIEGGKDPDQPFEHVAMFTTKQYKPLVELTVAANFVIVTIAKRGHPNPVSINYMEKVQIPNVYSFFGAMLAGVDYITMGAGLPFHVPGILDGLARGEAVAYPLTVYGSSGQPISVPFDPWKFFGHKVRELKRPGFLLIIASDSLATISRKKTTGSIEGFIIEMSGKAGGHSAPPRGTPSLNEHGEPIYGKKDEVNIRKIVDTGLPCWAAGGFASPQSLRYAWSLGMQGIQAGSIFVLSNLSGLMLELKREIIRRGYRGELVVITDPRVSSSGFPFNVGQIRGTLSEQGVYAARERLCDKGYLRTVHCLDDGRTVLRCPGEPVEDYISKGGKPEETIGVGCLCNGLPANTGLAQPGEPPIVTLGKEITSFLRAILPNENSSYTERQALQYLLQPV